MKKLRKILCVALVLLLLVASVPAVPIADLGFGITARALDANGSCGDNATYTFDSATGKLVIDGFGALYSEAFCENTDIKDVMIGDDITKISARAFDLCSNLENVNFGDNILEIDYFGFGDCKKLKIVVLPKNLLVIGDKAFEYCENLEKVIMNKNVTTIDYQAFYDCYKLNSINIPKEVNYIGYNAFHDCYNLKDIYYEGSSDDWKKIEIDGGNEALYNATIHFGAVSEPSTECEHNTGEHTVIQRVEPTCTEDGHYRYYQCKCGVYFNRFNESNNQLTEVIEDPTTFGVIPALGHDFIEDKCSRCGDYDVCKHDKANTLYVAGKNPTCTEDGFKSYYICQCGAKVQYPSLDKPKVLNDEELIVSALGHDFTDATCTEPKMCQREGCTVTEGTPVPHNVDGVEFTKYDDEYHTKKCVMCVIDVAYTKHIFSESVVTKAPTCTDKGEMTSICVCGAEKRTEIPADGHRWQAGYCKACDTWCKHESLAWYEGYDATCIYEGFKEHYECKDCYQYLNSNKEFVDKYDLIIPKTGHMFDTYFYDEGSATCYMDGTKTSICANGCGTKNTIADPGTKKDHELTDFTEITPATCTTDGEEIAKCFHYDKCGYSELFPAEALGHDDSGKFVETKAATCTEKGEKQKICTRCPEIVATEEIPAIGHDIADDYTIDVTPKCITPGSKSKHCSRCDYKEGETILPATGIHDPHAIYEYPTCTKNGTKYCECIYCGYTYTETIPATGHNYPDNWSVLVEPDCETKGINVKICLNCNDLITQKLPKAGHADLDGDSKCDTCDKEIIVAEPDEPTEPDTPDEPEVPEEKPCSCDCHAGGIKAFFFKLINFFAKIFDKSARVCECGKSH